MQNVGLSLASVSPRLVREASLLDALVEVGFCFFLHPTVPQPDSVRGSGGCELFTVSVACFSDFFPLSADRFRWGKARPVFSCAQQREKRKEKKTVTREGCLPDWEYGLYSIVYL